MPDKNRLRKGFYLAAMETIEDKMGSFEIDASMSVPLFPEYFDFMVWSSITGAANEAHSLISNSKWDDLFQTIRSRDVSVGVMLGCKIALIHFAKETYDSQDEIKDFVNDALWDKNFDVENYLLNHTPSNSVDELALNDMFSDFDDDYFDRRLNRHD